MNHTLHGDPVAIGDHVHDILRGVGVVELLRADGRIEVRFSAHRSLRVFTPDGRTGAREPITLYWHDPIVFMPIKDEAAYLAQREILSVVRAAMARALIEGRATEMPVEQVSGSLS